MRDDPPKSAVMGVPPPAASATASAVDPTDESTNPKEHAAAFNAALEISALYDRVQKMESSPKEDNGHWYNSALFSSVLSGVILAAFGFALTGRLEQAAKERSVICDVVAL